jgi:signal transduction histidine kinase
LGLGLSICREIAHLHQGSLFLTQPSRDTVQLALTAPLRAPP